MSTNQHITVYCPNGCNTSSIPAAEAVDECGGCGATMREDYYEEFSDAVAYSMGEPE